MIAVCLAGAYLVFGFLVARVWVQEEVPGVAPESAGESLRAFEERMEAALAAAEAFFGLRGGAAGRLGGPQRPAHDCGRSAERSSGGG